MFWRSALAPTLNLCFSSLSAGERTNVYGVLEKHFRETALPPSERFWRVVRGHWTPALETWRPRVNGTQLKVRLWLHGGSCRSRAGTHDCCVCVMPACLLHYTPLANARLHRPRLLLLRHTTPVWPGCPHLCRCCRERDCQRAMRSGGQCAPPSTPFASICGGKCSSCAVAAPCLAACAAHPHHRQ